MATISDVTPILMDRYANQLTLSDGRILTFVGDADWYEDDRDIEDNELYAEYWRCHATIGDEDKRDARAYVIWRFEADAMLKARGDDEYLDPHDLPWDDLSCINHIYIDDEDVYWA